MGGDEGLYLRRIGRHHLEALGQLLDSLHRCRPVGLAADRFDDGLSELGRQRGLEHDRRHARNTTFARDLQAVGRVRVDDGVEARMRVANRREPVGMRARSRDKTAACDAREFFVRDRERRTLLANWSPHLMMPLRTHMTNRNT